MSPPSIHQLLELRPFVRSLARQLTSDHALAEDIEQEAWMRALQRPPVHGQALKSWFSRVLRNVLINKVTSERRRFDREQLSFEERGRLGEPGLDHGRFAKELGEVLESLPRAQAEVLRLRFYEGLSAREVADRLNVPLNTVRTRLRRATVRMREELDRRYHNDRAEWLGCVVQLAALPVSRALRPAAVAVASIAATAVVVLAVLQAPPDSGSDVQLELAQQGATKEATPGPSAVDRQPVPEVREAALVSSAAAAIHLSARWEDGSPAGGVGLSLEPVAHGTEVDRRQAVLAADGRASLADLAPGRWRLRSTAGRQSELELRAGETTEIEWQLGLPHPLTLRVRQQREGGDTKIHVSLPGDAERWIEVGSTDADDTFQLAHFERSSWVLAVSRRRNMSFQVSLDHPYFFNDPSPHLEVPIERSRKPLEVTVHAPDGSALSGARVRFGSHPAPPPVRHLDGVVRREPTLTELTGADGRCRVFSMGVGALALTVTHDDFATWSTSIPMSQVDVDVHLQPKAEVSGIVQAPNGAAIAGAEIGWTTGSRDASGQSGPDGSFHLTHLPPGPLNVHITAEGEGEPLAWRGRLEVYAGEPRAWSPTLQPVPTLRGRALGENGQPLTGRWVALLESADASALSASRRPPDIRWSPVDERGGFTFGEFGAADAAGGRVLRLFASRELGIPLGWLDSVPYSAHDLEIGPLVTGAASATLILRCEPDVHRTEEPRPELMLSSPRTPQPVRGLRTGDEWAFTGLPAGEWTVLHWASNSAPTSVATIRVAEGETLRRSVPGPPDRGGLLVHVVDGAGAPLTPFSVQLSSLEDPSLRMRSYRTRRSHLLTIESDGSVRAQAPPGDYLLIVHYPGTVQQSRRVSIPPGETTEAEIVLTPGQPFLFRVELPQAERDVPRRLSFDFLDGAGAQCLEVHWTLDGARSTQEWTLRVPTDARTLRASLDTGGTAGGSTRLAPLPGAVAEESPRVLVDFTY